MWYNFFFLQLLLNIFVWIDETSFSWDAARKESSCLPLLFFFNQTEKNLINFSKLEKCRGKTKRCLYFYYTIKSFSFASITLK